MNQETIGKFIAACRKDKELTQTQLAEKLNITNRAVSKWETGKSIPDASKLATPISNGGLDFTPPGIITGSARGGISQYHYFWLPSYVGLTTFFRPLVYHSLLVPECICVLSLHSHFPLLKRNILLPRNVYPHIYFDTLGVCQTTSVYFYLLGMT